MTGCAARNARLATQARPPSTTNDYIDIQAGWRLTVVTPLTKSGRYVLRSLQQRSDGNENTLSAGTDLVGYEVAHYAVIGKGALVRVRFSSAEITKDDKTDPQPRSILPLFQSARRANYLRLIYLVRVSQADHNMAVVAARRLDNLDLITRQVEADPADGCKSNRDASCSWIPDGIAVRPERLKSEPGKKEWMDAPH
jgi:hypothetical protein